MISAFLFDFFLVFVVIQCLYALYFFIPFAFRKAERPQRNYFHPLSIIVCARNEEDSIKDCIEALLKQNYKDASAAPGFELLLVNDASADATGAIMDAYEQKYDCIKCIHIAAAEERIYPGKKYALHKAIAVSRHDFIVGTDADCIPASENWLQELVNVAAPRLSRRQEVIVLGYGAYRADSGFLNRFIRWETMHTFLQYGSFAARSFPYMGVGRNIAYSKSLMLKAQQSPVWKMTASGDDDIFIRLSADAFNTVVAEAPQSFTCSPAKTGFKEWMVQKQRHLSTGKYYKPAVKMLLGFYSLSHAFMWLLLLLLGMLLGNWQIPLFFVLVRCALYWMLWWKMARKLQEKRLALLLPFLDISWLLYNMLFSPYILWKNKNRWN